MGEDEFAGGFGGLLWDEAERAAEDAALMERVAEALRRMGEVAYTQATPLPRVVVERAGLTYFAGTAGAEWGVEVVRGEEAAGGFSLGVRSGSRDAEAIARAIVDAVHRRGE